MSARIETCGAVFPPFGKTESGMKKYLTHTEYNKLWNVRGTESRCGKKVADISKQKKKAD